MAETGDTGVDVVGGLGPDERLRGGVGLGDVGEDRRLEVVGAGEGATFEATPARSAK